MIHEWWKGKVNDAVWKPKYGELYYFVSPMPERPIYWSKWGDSFADWANYRLGNCFERSAAARANRKAFFQFILDRDPDISWRLDLNKDDNDD